jgi:hypothetical protein
MITVEEKPGEETDVSSFLGALDALFALVPRGMPSPSIDVSS